MNAGQLKKLLSNVPNNAEIILKNQKDFVFPLEDVYTEAERDEEGRKLQRIVIEISSSFDNF